MSLCISSWSPPATAPPTGPADVEGLPESVKKVTWFSTRELFFVDLALPLQPDMEQVEDEDAMYAQLLTMQRCPTLCANNVPLSWWFILLFLHGSIEHQMRWVGWVDV